MRDTTPRAAIAACVLLLAAAHAGCGGRSCADVNTDATGVVTLDATRLELVRTFEVTLTTAGYASERDLAIYRAQSLALDMVPQSPAASDAPQGEFDVLVTAERLDLERPAQQVITDMRDGISLGGVPLFSDCGATGPCVREIRVSIVLQHPETASGAVEWRARTLGSSTALECGDDPPIVIRDITAP